MAEALSTHTHHKPQVGERAPSHWYPLLLVVPGTVGLLAVVAGLFTVGWLAIAGVVVVVGGLLAFVAVPSPIRAQAWFPQPAPRPTDARSLSAGELLLAGQVSGPEDLAPTPDGRTLFVSSYGDGRILRVDLDDDGSPHLSEHATTGGSPVDLTVTADGGLLVCDWSAGLLAVDPDGAVSTVLALGTPVDGKPFVRPDGISVAADGTWYVSEGSNREGGWNGVFEALEAGQYGRVFAFDPVTQQARTVVDGLSFANGNAIEPAGRYLVVADQYRYRIARLWLTGPDAGTVDTFADNLPGLPHNLHYDAEGLLWCGLYQLRDATLDRVSPRPRLKNVLAKLPPSVVEGPFRIADGKPGRGGVLALDSDGRQVHYFIDPPSRVDTVSAAVRIGDDLYVSTLTGDAIVRVRLT